MINKYSFHSLKKLLQYFVPHKSALILVMISVLLISCLILNLGNSLKYLIDKGFQSGNYYFLNKSLSILLFLIISLTLAIFCRSFFIHSVCEKIMNTIRIDLYKKSLFFTPSYFEINKTSDIVVKMTNDVVLLSGIIVNIFSFAARNFLMFIGSVALLFKVNFTLSLYVAGIIPFVVGFIIAFGKKVRYFSHLSQASLSSLSAEIQESLNNIKVVHSFNLEVPRLEKFIYLSNNSLFVSLKRVKARSLLVAIVILLVFSAVSIVLWLGGHYVIQGRMTKGELSSFIFYAIIAASSLGSISEIIADFQRALGAADRIFTLLDAQFHYDVKTSNLTIDLTQPVNIEFKNIFFSYPSTPNFLAINDFSFQIFPNEKIAIVGPSGSGKTTIFQLLLRFYDINSGNIIINNIPLQDINLNNLRSVFCYVPQEPVIFSGNAYDNIALTNQFSKDQVYEAAKIANIYDFLIRLPQGFDTFLGEKGVRLSGGEKQRIALARAAIRNPQILLLDEATSSLDAINETLIQNSIDKIMANKMTIAIAHRMSTIINSSRIIVLNNGRIENVGNHKTLINTCNLYQKLIKEIKS